ncbi:MAG: DNA starvation/stationary phase protection protein [Spirochaetales bacterium]|nr:DNA starvation/stationary phase protection protein [Spirochaetales bacterium]
MNKIELMNKYVANLAVLNVKLHNLHWNVVGIRFMSVHQFTESLYDDFFAKFDDVAEQIKILGQTPVSTLKGYLAIADVEEIEEKDFATTEVLKIVKADLELMNKTAKEIRAVADEEGDFNTVAMFEEHSAGYEKNLWFLSAMLKK